MTYQNQLSPTRFLVRLLIWVIVGFIIGNIAMLAVLFAAGVPLDTITSGSWITDASFSLNHMRLILLLNHLFIFVAAGITAFWMQYGRGWWQEADLATSPSNSAWLPGITALLVSIPAVQWLYQMNQNLPLPQSLMQSSDSLNELVGHMLKVNTFSALLFNLLVIAVVPAIGEELVFRAGLQKHLQKWIQSPHAAIWLTAFGFSFFHSFRLPINRCKTIFSNLNDLCNCVNEE
jgi:membrane protease YdiL (CAAX protease family)